MQCISAIARAAYHALSDPPTQKLVNRRKAAPLRGHHVGIQDTLEYCFLMTARAPWFAWMALGGAAVIVLDSHTDVVGELGHGCRGLNCNTFPERSFRGPMQRRPR